MTDSPMTDTPQPNPPSQIGTADIIAVGDNWYRGKMLILALALLVYCGGFFLYDGFVRYPRNNRRIDELDAQRTQTSDPAENERLKDEQFKLGTKKSDADILLQKVIGMAAIPVGLYVLVNSMRKSRGQVKLSGQTLYVPGHPPVPFEAITAVDQRLWDKKGIAYISYSLAEGNNGRLTLDDYIYQRKPVDQIYDAILAYIAPSDDEDKAKASS